MLYQAELGLLQHSRHTLTTDAEHVRNLRCWNARLSRSAPVCLAFGPELGEFRLKPVQALRVALYLHEINDAQRRAVERSVIEKTMGDLFGG